MIEQKASIDLLDSKTFEKKINGKQVGLYTLRNANGVCAQLTNFGARLVALWLPDSNGNWRDVVLGFRSIDEYLDATEKYHGATIGRFANRIANGRFSLNEQEYTLATNNGENHLHGGEKGFDSVVWGVNEYSSKLLKLTYVSPHLEEGYPGNLSVQVTYSLSDRNELKIEYRAITDQPTIVNLTHHSYFNLKGEGRPDIDDHVLKIAADRYTPINDLSIPIGKFEKVNRTPLDFRKDKEIGKYIDKDFEQLMIANGYDHNYEINTLGQGEPVATVTEKESGLQMKVYTDQPGLQFYTANFLDGSDIGKSGIPYTRRNSFCLETQHFPDSPNQEAFPSTTLNPEEEYRSFTIYQFGLIS